MARKDLSGTWKLDRSENLDELMHEIGTGFLLRQFAKLARPTNFIEQKDDKFMIHVKTARGERLMDFTVGDEWEEDLKAYNGRFKCYSSWEGDAMVISYTPLDPKNKTYTEKRQLIDDEYILTVSVNDVTCRRIFKRTA